MFRFASPYLLLFIIPLGAAAWLIFSRRRRAGIVFAPTHRFTHAAWSWRITLNKAAAYLFVAGVACTIIAFGRPQIVLSESMRKTDAIAIEMVVDVSGSMEALDFSSSSEYRTRLDVVKQTFGEFVKNRPHDLIGVVIFGGYATSLVPLTIDHSALLHALKGVEIPRQILNEKGEVLNQEERLTAIGDALASACTRLEDAKVKSKIIVLLSDGESNTGIIKPQEAMNAAKELGIKVYTIGVGSTGLAPFRVRDIFGREVIRRARVSLDEQLLRQIAKTTGGEYFNVKDPKGLEKALEDIDKLERTKIERKVYYQYQELFPFFLIPAIVLVMTGTTLKLSSGREMI